MVATADDEDGDAYELAYDALLEFRGYDDLDRETAMRRVVTELYGLPPELVEANPKNLDSLQDSWPHMTEELDEFRDALTSGDPDEVNPVIEQVTACHRIRPTLWSV